MGEHNNGRGGYRPGAGRPKGSMNDTGISPRELRIAMIEGAKNSRFGKDPNNPDAPGTLVNFFTNIASEYPAAFCTLFGKLIPRHVNMTTEQDTTINVTYRSVAEVKDAMLAHGMTSLQIEQLEAMLPTSDVIEEPEAVVKDEE
jgi:hypothetical protein